MSQSRLQSLISNIDHMTCSLSSKNSPRNTVDFEAACSVYIRYRGVNGYLTPTKILLPFDSGGVDASGNRLPPAQVEGGGGAALFPTPATNSDPASGKIKFTITHHGSEIEIVGTLSDISNVSAVTVHDLKYPATLALRGSTTPTAGQPATVPATTIPLATVNTFQTTTGQILLSNIGHTVAVLLKPGMGSGPIGKATFTNVIKAQYLEGPLAGKRLSSLINDMQDH